MTAGYHAPTACCPGCKVAMVAVRKPDHGPWSVRTYGADGNQLAQVRCDSEDEARAVARLAADAHGVKDYANGKGGMP